VAAEDEFPQRPMPAMGAIVFRRREVILVERGTEPNAGRWGLPGGLLKIGETVESGAVRETLEETRVHVRPRRLFDVSDFIRSEGGRIRWHYVLIDFLCDYVEGEPSPRRMPRTPGSSLWPSSTNTTLRRRRWTSSGEPRPTENRRATGRTGTKSRHG